MPVMGTTAVSEVSEDVSKTASKLNEYVNDILDAIFKYGTRLILVLIFVVIAFKIVKVIVKGLRKAMERREVDVSVAGFLASFCDVGLKIIVLISAASALGVAVTSFVTLLGTASVAIGLALQGSLANLAGGVLILILKPYRVGDYIVTETAGNEGTVTSIDIFYTRLRTLDNKLVVIPNGELSNSSITNVTNAEKRRVDFEFSISYESDIKKAKEIVTSAVREDERVLDSEPVDLYVSELADSGINMGLHVWVKSEDYFPVKWELLEAVKLKLDEGGIEIPYPHMDVKINTEK